MRSQRVVVQYDMDGPKIISKKTTRTNAERTDTKSLTSELPAQTHSESAPRLSGDAETADDCRVVLAGKEKCSEGQ